MQVPVKNNGSEQVHYNNPEVPMYIRRGNLSYYDGYRAISHWHEDIEFIYINQGSMKYRINEALVTLQEGEGIFVNSRQLHYGFSDVGEDCSFLCVLIQPAFISTNNYIVKHYVTPLLTDDAYPYVILHPDIPWQADLLQLLIQTATLEDKELVAFSMQIQASLLFQSLLQNLPVTHKKSPSHEQALLVMKKMIQFIQLHFEEKITLAQIAASGNISKSQCGILFQTHTGLSPIEYLTEYRLQLAKQLLSTTDMPILHIALETGFNSSSYFCETFRKKNNITPLEYRIRTGT